MNDCELLEMAAKAAGYEWRGISSTGKPLLQHPSTGERFYAPTVWNPIDDDGDALRLAVKLKLSVKHGIDIWDDTQRLSAYAYFGDFGACYFEPHGSDANAATRRAIVRAAAKIGAAAKKGTP